jgi:hypothetical protein
VLRRTVIFALQDPGSNARTAGWATKIVTITLEDSDASVRVAATNALQRIQKDVLNTGGVTTLIPAPK